MNGKGGVQAVGRALEILKILSQSDEGLRVSDVARSSGFAVSTTHRLLTTLEQHGFAQFDSTTQLWHVGREAFAVGAAFSRRRNFVVPALPYLKRLRDVTRETSNLGILDGDELVTMSQVESREIMRAISPPGGRVPAFCSGMGKAILSTWDESDVRHFSDRVGFHPMTRKSLTNIDDALRELDRIRELGYALDDEEHISGLRCIAAVVGDAHGDAACAISVSGLAMRLDDDRVKTVSTAVIQASKELTLALGGQTKL